MQEHPNAAMIRRLYEARIRGDAVADLGTLATVLGREARTPVSIAAVGELAVAIDRGNASEDRTDLGVVVFHVVDGRVVDARRYCVNHIVRTASQKARTLDGTDTAP